MRFTQRPAAVMTKIPTLYVLFMALLCTLYGNEHGIETNDESAAGHSQIHGASLSLMRTIE
jgi:hypothetical protein